MLKTFVSDLVVGYAVLACCGCFGCGRAADPVDPRSPQELLSSVAIKLTPSTRDGSMLCNPAPQSGLNSVATVPPMFEVRPEVVFAHYYNSKTGEVYANANSTAFNISASRGRAEVFASATSPLEYKLRFTPTFTADDGTVFEGTAVEQAYRLGD